jgi:ubiquinone biosynthesis protein UbiJ
VGDSAVKVSGSHVREATMEATEAAMEATKATVKAAAETIDEERRRAVGANEIAFEHVDIEGELVSLELYRLQRYN